MSAFVISFQEIDSTKSFLVGGKAVTLAALSGIKEIKVPDGFCITTEAFRKAIDNNSGLNPLLKELSRLHPGQWEQICSISTKIRTRIKAKSIGKDLSTEIKDYLTKFTAGGAFAVRSSATAEDLPTASFAGQHDTCLNLIGSDSILQSIQKCWASLFTDRAVIYRMKNGFDHSKVYLSVIVQKMIFSQASGILFTADPITSNRKLLSIDAGFGLGEAMVSGLVSPDRYKVKDDKIVDKIVGTKKLAILPRNGGGTETRLINPEHQKNQTLTDQQILELAGIGRKIESHFGRPQDIEWCLADDQFYIVQSRPITTLYPVPESNDHQNRVYLSVGHQQMMTDPIRPLGLSLFLLVTRAPMRVAGGRLFIDVTTQITSPDSSKSILDVMEKSDPLMHDALLRIVEREDFISVSPASGTFRSAQSTDPAASAFFQSPIEDDPKIPADLISSTQASIEALKAKIQRKSGLELFDFIIEDLQELKRILFSPESAAVFMTAINASVWLNQKMKEWLGEINAADIISQSVPNNITSEMGLALLDLADTIRPYPDIIAYLQHKKGEHFLDQLVHLHGGIQCRDAINVFLQKFGMRCTGEIDITNTRWSEQPVLLAPIVLSNIQNFEPGASNRKFEQGKRNALMKEQELLGRLMQLPGGEEKVAETKRVISLIRNFIGYREYPKYGMISRYLVYKQALLKEAQELVKAGLIPEREDIYFLTFEELREVIRTASIDYQLINKRKGEYQFFHKLTPPRVITSDGEILVGKYNRENLPSGALAGLAVSKGIVEGRARVIFRIQDAVFEPGDILVTPFTDPGWTAVFVSIKGLVTEVGGLMTHGAVIAREYGLPAVVGVENATTIIKDGQMIRLNGTDGYVQILSRESS